jgi:Lar family restriction alleviation protein
VSDDLKPCPFCGGEASLREDFYHSAAFYVGCQTSGCFGSDQWDETRAEAVTAWNTRADTDEITRLRTALSYLRDDKTLTMPGYFRRIAALALRGESIKAWASPTIGDDTASNRGKG